MSRAPAARPGIRVERRGRIAILTLARGGEGNRLDAATARAFVEACAAADEDDVACVVVEHEGKDFCRGFDGEFEGRGADPVAALAAVRAPVVAAISGRAEGEGVELALAADLRILAPSATLRLTQVAEGRIPAHGATQRLPRIVGAEIALRSILLGERIPARRALAIGLAARIAPRPRAAALALAKSIAERAPIALRFAKEAVRRSGDLALADGASLEHDLYALLQTTDDRREGVRAFLDKRTPRFAGR